MSVFASSSKCSASDGSNRINASLLQFQPDARRARPGRGIVMLHLAACVITAFIAGNCLTLGFYWFGAANVIFAFANASLVARRVG